MTPDQPSDKVNAVLRGIDRHLSKRIAYHWENLPDAQRQPVSYAIAMWFIATTDRQLTAIRAGSTAIKQELGERPGAAIRAVFEMESWLVPRIKQSKLTDKAEDIIGNLLVSSGLTYGEARYLTRLMQQVPGGAPSKRPQTLKLMDAKIANRWSYAKLTMKMCDCQERTHDEKCVERIRKRIAELQRILVNHGINYCTPKQ